MPEEYAPEFEPLSGPVRALCDAHQCPACLTREQVTVERVIEGLTSVTRCHCRACGHSWHPQVEDL